MSNVTEKTIWINSETMNLENALRSIHSINNGGIRYANSEDKNGMVELPFEKGTSIPLDDFISFISKKNQHTRKMPQKSRCGIFQI